MNANYLSTPGHAKLGQTRQGGIGPTGMSRTASLAGAFATKRQGQWVLATHRGAPMAMRVWLLAMVYVAGLMVVLFG